jgi:hypothetical protein
VGGVAALKEAPRSSPPLHAKLVQGMKLYCWQGNLIVVDALIPLSEAAAKEDKANSKANETVSMGLSS